MTTQHTDEIREAFESAYRSGDHVSDAISLARTEDGKYEQALARLCFKWFLCGNGIATASTEAKYLPVIEKLVSALNNCQPAESAWLAEHFFAEESSDSRVNPILQDKWKAHDASSVLREEALSLAAPLLKEDK